MKNVMIVTRQGNTVALGEGIKICKSGTGVFMSNLEALKEVLLAIPTEPCETVNIHIMDTIQGLVSGTAVEYVKSGKTLSGTTLTTDEIAMFKEIYQLYAERILNVKFSLVKYIRKDDVANQNLKKQAYDELALYEKSAGVSRGTAVTVDPDKELREMFDAQIKEAMANKDMATVKDLMEMRKSLREPEVVMSNNSNRTAPSFESSPSDVAVNNNADEPEDDVADDTPITFETVAGDQPAF